MQLEKRFRVSTEHESDRARLKDHPLIEAKRQGHQYDLRFRYEFLAQLLLARYLVRTIKGSSGRSESLTPIALDVMERQAEGTGALFDHMCDVWDVGSLDPIGRCSAKIGPDRERAASFLFHLARAIHKDRYQSASRRERSDQVLGLFGGESYRTSRTIRKLYVHGTIDRFDLAGVTFEYCTFVNVVFADCSVDRETSFRKCRFLGEFDITGNEKKDWTDVKDPVDCEMDIAARLAWEDMRKGRAASREQVARDVLKIGLGKFWYHGRLKRTIAKHDWNKGIMGRLGIGPRLLKAMEKVGLIEEIHISGVSEGGYALLDGAIREVQQFMDNGLLVGKVRAVYESLL